MQFKIHVLLKKIIKCYKKQIIVQYSAAQLYKVELIPESIVWEYGCRRITYWKHKQCNIWLNSNRQEYAYKTNWHLCGKNTVMIFRVITSDLNKLEKYVIQLQHPFITAYRITCGLHVKKEAVHSNVFSSYIHTLVFWNCSI